MENTIISEHTQRSHRLKIASHVARMIVGLVFVFSGFVKAVDPWGTMIKVTEYLTIYRIVWFAPLSAIISIWLSGAELMMGLMLTFKVRIRMVSTFALISMCFFTLLSFLSATVIPVEDCGCFGDAIRLTPWATFGKNLLLLPLIAIVWYRYKSDKMFAFNKLELFLAAMFFTLTMGLGTYCFYHLPLLDFRPYKVGVNLPEAIKVAYASYTPTTTTTLLYKNIATGKVREFAIDDVTWQDESKWEWVDTITEVEDVSDYKHLIAEFSVFDYNGNDKTEDLLSQEGGLVMLCVSERSRLKERVLEKVSSAITAAEIEGKRVVVLTPETIGGDVVMVDNHELEVYNIDSSTMKTMLRANVGVVVLHDGVIVQKRSWRGL